MTSRGDERGLFEALRGLSATALGMLQSRLELASLEVEEARDRLVFTLILALAAALLIGAAVAALSVWLAFAVWDRTGPGILALLALAYVAAAVVVLLWLRARLRREPALFADTLTELRHDARVLRGESIPRAAEAARGAPAGRQPHM